jgi:3-oxoadipate enol-lactonase
MARRRQWCHDSDLYRISMTELSYLRRGRGEPLLLIMGMAGHHRMWREDFLELLEPHFDVVAYDHRGIGGSDRADEPFSIADLADDAAGLIGALGWEKAHVFGISLGGMVGQELVLRHPDLVGTLTLGCTWAGGESGIMPDMSRRIVEGIATRDPDIAIATGYEGNFSPDYRADPANLASYREISLSVKVPVPVVLMQWQAALALDTIDRLPTVSAPTMIMHGTLDAGIAVENAHLIAAAIPGARLELFDGKGHLFWWEDPERAAALLIEHTKAG